MSNNRNADIWIAGAFAAFTVDLVVYPLDTIKTRIQSPDYLRIYTRGANHAVDRALFRGVYQGIGSVIIATLPSSGAFFTTYEGVKVILDKRNPRARDSPLLPQPLIHAAASSIAEVVSCAIVTPAEVIKQNAQMVNNSDSARPRINATLETMKRFRSNPFALWRGYTSLVSRNLPFTALQFPLFESIKQRIRQYRDERGIRTRTLLEAGWITGVSAAMGGSIAAFVTTPVDVIKTRIMLSAADGPAKDQKAVTQGAERAKGGMEVSGKTLQVAKERLTKVVHGATTTPSRKGSMQIAREILKDQGVKGLFRGGALRVVWTMLGSGMYLSVYESSRLYLASRRGEKLNEDNVL